MAFDSGKMYWWLQTLVADGQGGNIAPFVVSDEQGIAVGSEGGPDRIIPAGGIQIWITVSGAGGLILIQTQQACVRIAVKHRNAVAVAV